MFIQENFSPGKRDKIGVEKGRRAIRSKVIMT